jgi:hypothetical protein
VVTEGMRHQTVDDDGSTDKYKKGLNAIFSLSGGSLRSVPSSVKAGRGKSPSRREEHPVWSDPARTVRCLGPGTMPSPFPARPVRRCRCLPVVAYRGTPMQPLARWQRLMLSGMAGHRPAGALPVPAGAPLGPPFLLACWGSHSNPTNLRCLPNPVSAGLLMLLRHTLVSDEGDMSGRVLLVPCHHGSGTSIVAY